MSFLKALVSLVKHTFVVKRIYSCGMKSRRKKYSNLADSRRERISITKSKREVRRMLKNRNIFQLAIKVSPNCSNILFEIILNNLC